MSSQYEIFISYRRNGGEALACLLSEKLKQLGYSVFYDVESLRSGLFNEKLLSVIEECKDVIVVLPENGLDRCVNDDDWVRKEIAHALNQNKNIIPVMMRSFEWPNTMPEEIEQLRNYNGLTANMEYFDATFNKLLTLLSTFSQRSFLDKEFIMLYHSFSPILKKKEVVSKLSFDSNAHAKLLVNYRADKDSSEYQYQGVVNETDTTLYVDLRNNNSTERLFISLLKPAGNLGRFIGIISALTPSMFPVSFKCICVSSEDVPKIDQDMLRIVLEHNNKEWNNNILAIEAFQTNLFYSDSFFSE